VNVNINCTSGGFMPVKDVFKVSRKTFFNPRAWLGYDELKNQTKTIWDTLRALFTSSKPQRQETFEQAMQRLQLSEKDIKEKQATYLNYAIAFIILAVCSFLSSFYYLIHHHTFSGMILGFAVTTLFATQAFRFHFWYFQIKHRKLGCTYKEWRQGKPFEPGEPTA
jgi:intracellular multiplication protein IcmV